MDVIPPLHHGLTFARQCHEGPMQSTDYANAGVLGEMLFGDPCGLVCILAAWQCA